MAARERFLYNAGNCVINRSAATALLLEYKNVTQVAYQPLRRVGPAGPRNSL
jgi:hypothetical protein